MKTPSSVPALVDHLFRRSAVQMTTALTRTLGTEHLELAEEVVQEAMLKALQVWPMQGIPDNPQGWLFRVARNGALDRLRRRSNFSDKLHVVRVDALSASDEDRPDPLADDELRMIVLCCHPALSRDSRVALTLKLASGFGVGEIARAFLTTRTTIAQRLVRAKATLRDHRATFDLPEAAEWPDRLDAILDVLYLMFNEGYSAYEGDTLIRSELCHEAIRLGTLLANYGETRGARLDALLALMHLQASRLPARVDGNGGLVRLEDQDRDRWDRIAIARGMRHLERSATGTERTAYHVEAAIAAVHAVATSYETTDWRYMVTLYDQLIALNPSPIVALNRAVAIAMADGLHEGIRAASALENDRTLRHYFHLPATLGELYARIGETRRACEYFERALALPCSAPEQDFVRQRWREMMEIERDDQVSDSGSGATSPRGSSR